MDGESTEQIISDEELKLIDLTIESLRSRSVLYTYEITRLHNLVASHRAQSAYIEAQDKSGAVWMKENAALKQELLDSRDYPDQQGLLNHELEGG